MRNKCTRRAVTLIEVLIAMALTTIILSTLLFFYQQVMTLGHDLDIAKEEGFYRRYVENRLGDTLPKIKSLGKKEGLLFFSTDDSSLTMPNSQSLFFTFDHHISMDKIFSNVIIARLFVDAEGQLTLAYWPAPKQWENGAVPRMRREVLLRGVKSLAFHFFVAVGKDKEAKKAEKEAQSGKDGKMGGQEASKDGETSLEPLQEGWHENLWPKERQELPVLLKVIMVMADGEEIVFIFPLVHSSEHIVY